MERQPREEGWSPRPRDARDRDDTGNGADLPRHPHAALHGLWRDPARDEPALRLHGARFLRARALRRGRRLHCRRADDASPRAPPGAHLARGRPRRRNRGGAGGRPLRPLRQDLLRHADARLRHGLLHVPAQVLPDHGRRRGHAHASPLPARQRVGRLLQDRLPRRPLLLLLAGGAGPGDAAHVAHRGLALRALPPDHPRQSDEGGEPGRERAALSLVRLHDLRGVRGGRGASSRRPPATWIPRSPTGRTPGTSSS